MHSETKNSKLKDAATISDPAVAGTKKARIVRAPRRTKSKRLLARLASVESPDVTYVAERFPIVMKRGNGMFVHDVDDNRYLDFTACFGVLALGHRSKVTLGALRKQSAKLIHGMGDVHPTEAKIQLLETLADITPFDAPKTILSLSGGEAVESALKTALLITKRERFLSFAGGYHGMHFGPLALSDRELFKRGFEGYLGTRNTQISFPYSESALACENVDPHTAAKNEMTLDAWGAIKVSDIASDMFQTTHGLLHWDDVLTQLEDALKTKSYAALVMEPLQGRGGERTYPAGFVRLCANLARKYGTLLIFDEIYSGFGRTGKMFALEHDDVVPDLLCLGKALGGGLPLSACVGDVMDVWGKSQGEARHTSTFLGHPLACAVGHATLLALKRDLKGFQKSLVGIEKLTQKFVEQCRSAGIGAHTPFRVRGRGFMFGFWFYQSTPGFAAVLAEQLLELGFVVLPSGPRGDVLSFTPPLIATADHFAKLYKALFALLKK